MDGADRRPKRADLGPVTREYVRSMGWRSVNLHTHISLVNRYVYVEVPKAGCGTMKATLGGVEASRMGPAMVERVQENPHDRSRATAFVKPFQLPADQLEDVLTSTDFRRFAVVREPASRLLAGYLDKIVQALPQSVPIADSVSATLGTDVAPADITFEQFIDVVTAQASRDQDPHWRRQADHLGMGIVEYDAIIHLENLDASWGRIAELTGVADLAEHSYLRRPTAAASRQAEFYTEHLRTRVGEAYARDYATLAYPPI